MSDSGAIWLWIAFNVIVIVVALLFERGRYKPKVSGGDGWQRTGEKFQDPTTGKWMAVRFNKKTGERDYIETDN